MQDHCWSRIFVRNNDPRVSLLILAQDNSEPASDALSLQSRVNRSSLDHLQPLIGDPRVSHDLEQVPVLLFFAFDEILDRIDGKVRLLS
jgi:hypothetical protein